MAKFKVGETVQITDLELCKEMRGMETAPCGTVIAVREDGKVDVRSANGKKEFTIKEGQLRSGPLFDLPPPVIIGPR